MAKMLVTQALNELKTLDARIIRAISDSSLIASAKTCEKKVTPSKLKETFIKDAQASYDSINDLINRREAIKSAIVESNANTEVEVCGEKHSVAKVIDMKSSIGYKRRLLMSMKIEFERAEADMNSKNAIMENKIDKLVETAFGKESKQNIKNDDYAAIADPYRKANEYSLVDPLGLEKKIKDLENYIEEFESTVDSVLQVSNCTTYIEV